MKRFCIALFLLFCACSSKPDSIILNLKSGLQIEIDTEKDVEDYRKFLAKNSEENYKDLSAVPKELRQGISNLKSIAWDNSFLELRDAKFYIKNGGEESEFSPRTSLLVLIMLSIRDYNNSKAFYTGLTELEIDSFVFRDRKTSRQVTLNDKEQVSALKEILMNVRRSPEQHRSYLAFSTLLTQKHFSLELLNESQFTGEIEFDSNPAFPVYIEIKNLTLKYIDSENKLRKMLGVSSQ